MQFLESNLEFVLEMTAPRYRRKQGGDSRCAAMGLASIHYARPEQRVPFVFITMSRAAKRGSYPMILTYRPRTEPASAKGFK